MFMPKWTPETRLVSALTLISEAVSHASWIARTSPSAQSNADKALRLLEQAEQVLGRDVARDLSLPGYRAAYAEGAKDESGWGWDPGHVDFEGDIEFTGEGSLMPPVRDGEGQRAVSERRQARIAQAILAVSQSRLAGMKLRFIKPVELKGGDFIHVGDPAVLSWRRDNHEIVDVYVPSLDRTIKLKSARLHEYFGKPFRKPPSIRQLWKESDDGVSTSVTGKRVEPDGYGSDGSPSWMLVLGLI
jgi:hypothetical protein